MVAMECRFGKGHFSFVQNDTRQPWLSSVTEMTLVGRSRAVSKISFQKIPSSAVAEQCQDIILQNDTDCQRESFLERTFWHCLATADECLFYKTKMAFSKMSLLGHPTIQHVEHCKEGTFAPSSPIHNLLPQTNTLPTVGCPLSGRSWYKHN